MEKEDIEVVAKIITDIKDSLDELENGLKKNSPEKVVAAKRKILELQVKIGRKI